MITGIYSLNFKGTDKVYVGQAKDIKKRFWEHLYSFKNNAASKKLLEAHRIYGEPYYTVLCECTVNELNHLENEAIEIFNSYSNGFNTFRTEGGSLRSQSGLDHSNSKYSKTTILKVFSLLYRTTIPYSKIASRLKLNTYLVNNLASGNHHLWLQHDYPDKFKMLLSNKAIRNRKNLKTLEAKQLLISPTNEEHWVQNISEFCRNQPDLSLNIDSSRSNIAKVLKGTKRSHLGWKLG